MGEYLVYLTKIEKSIYRGDPCVDFLEAAYICAAINTLTPRHLGGWLKFAYGPDDLKTVQSSLASTLRFGLFPVSNAKKHERLLNLCNTALEDYRLRVHRNRTLPNVLYADRMGVHPEHWNRDWKDYQDKCIGEVISWDREGVGMLSSMVKALREGEHRPTEVLIEIAS